MGSVNQDLSACGIVESAAAAAWYGFKRIIIGDSHMARGVFVGATSGAAGTVVSDGTTVTWTASATHYLDAGHRVTVFASSTGASAGIHDGMVLEVLTAADTTHFTTSAYGPNGFYFSAGDWSSISGGGWSFNKHHQSQDYGVIPWMDAYLGCPFITVGAYAYGGTTSSRWAAIANNIATGQKIDYAFICTGYNDMAGGLTADSVFTNILTLVAAVQAAGGIPVILTPPPYNNNVVGYSTAKGVEFGRLHKLLTALGRVDRSIIVLDFFGICIDGQSATGNYKSGYDDTSTHAHVIINYCSVVGKALAAQLAPYLPPYPDIFPMSTHDDVGRGATAKNRVQNGLMAGGGAGTLPTNWLNSGSAATVTTTGNYTQASGYGWGCRQQISATANQDLYFRQAYTREATPQWYIGGVEVEVVTPPVNLQSMQLSLQNNGTGYECRAIWGSHSGQASANIQLSAGDKLRIITPPMRDTNRTASTQQLMFRPFWSGVGTADFAIGRAFVYSVPSPYLETEYSVRGK